MDEVAARLLPDRHRRRRRRPVVTPRRLRPRRRGQAGHQRCSTPTCNLPEAQIEATGARAWRIDDRVAVLQAYDGERANRRHKPGRALERSSYRFDVLADYGAFRDLQRHRMLTIEWQPLTPHHGYTRPEAVDAGRCGRPRSTRPWSARRRSTTTSPSAFPAAGVLRRLAGLPGALRDADERPRGHAPHRAAHHARRATPPTGWSARRCTGSSPRRPATTAIAEMMRFVDHSAEPELERLQAERRAEARRRLGR